MTTRARNPFQILVIVLWYQLFYMGHIEVQLIEEMNIPAPYVLFRFSSPQFDHSKKTVTHCFVPLSVKGCVFLEKAAELEGR